MKTVARCLCLLFAITLRVADASAQGSFVPTGSMNHAHSNGHTATLLLDGNVLVAGGLGGSETSITATEVYDRGSESWHNSASMTARRTSHTATLLHNGKVLIVGGFDQQTSGTTVHATAELYDPKTDTWAATGSLSTPRALHTAALLNDGTVLVAGGFSDTDVLSSAEVYDPKTGNWSAVASMGGARFSHTMTDLYGLALIVAGGYASNGMPLDTAEIFDPIGKTWSATGSMTSARGAHTATRLQDGKVLIAGGIDVPVPVPPGFQGLATAEVYDPQTGVWAPTGSMSSPRFAHSATPLRGGDVLIAGGEDMDVSVLDSAERYDPKTGLWTSDDDLTTRRATHTATLLRDGRVLVAGGFLIGTALSSAELYLPKN